MFPKITNNKYLYWLAIVMPKTSYYNLSFNFVKKKRFGDVDLAGKLNNADLCRGLLPK